MSFSDSMFLAEIKVLELISHIECEEFIIKSKFANVFVLILKNPNYTNSLFSNNKNKLLNTTKVRESMEKKLVYTSTIEELNDVGQFVMFTSQIDTLIVTMKNDPIELTLFSQRNHKKLLGRINIPWSPVYIDYMYKIKSKLNIFPADVTNSYNIYDDCNSRRIATIKLKIKLSHLKDNVTSFRSVPRGRYNKKKTDIYSQVTTSANRIIQSPHIKYKNKRVQSTIKIRKCQDKTMYNKCEESTNNKMKTHHKTTYNMQTMPITQPVYNQLKKLDGKQKFTMCKINNDDKYDNALKKYKEPEVIDNKNHDDVQRNCLNLLHYIYGDIYSPMKDQVVCVNYCTIENDCNKDVKSTKSSSFGGYSSDISNNIRGSNDDSLVFPAGEHIDLINVAQCSNPDCQSYKERQVSKVNDSTLLDLEHLKSDCCVNTSAEVKNIIEEINTNMKLEKSDCFCSCECTFEFMKRTTYCGICGGYERAGEDMPTKVIDVPFPCPVYHKLIDKNKQRALSTSGSDKSKTRGEDSLKSAKKGTKSPISTNKTETKNNIEKKRKKDDIFKYYGYKAPQLGHSRCVMPCKGNLGAVPTNMGWLWTADDVPGMKFRPCWKPGASNKHVVRALKLAKYPDKKLKRKKKDTGKKKRALKRPLLAISKKDGEYTVTMETMKTFSKPRAPNQYPYEDKPILTYTIGRTEEEKKDRRKKKERLKRRLERNQRAFIQSTFKNMCKEICLKTYQQALGILPDGEDPDCVCYPKYPGPDDTNLDHSCSCSEDSKTISSDSATDSDEWIVEFTPPNATFDPFFIGKKIIKIDNSSQYTYLDYKVKLLDRYGNPIPRYFKDLHGKTQCSDLGGFWSPDHKWLEINTDGYIGPDGRWAPVTFIGPNGDQVDCDSGKFQLGVGGIWLVVGVDGYIDATGKWKYYPKCKGLITPIKKRTGVIATKDSGFKKFDATTSMPTALTWSCFGDVNAKDLSKMGIYGHGSDRKRLLQTLNKLIAHGENVRVPQNVSRLPNSKKAHHFKPSVPKCKHPKPSNKGVIAVDGHGHKTYFRLKDYSNKRPKDRINQLTDQGISLSSFHAPCFYSFINQEMMKKQLYERRLKMANTSKHVCNHGEFKRPASPRKYSKDTAASLE